MSGLRRKIAANLYVWYLLGVLWLAQVLSTGVLIVFRSVKSAGIARAIQFDDVPLLRWFDLEYATLFWFYAAGALTVAVLFAALAWPGCGSERSPSPGRRRPWGRNEWSALAGIGCFSVFTLAALAACRPIPDDVLLAIQPISWIDWLAVAALAACGWVLPPIITSGMGPSKPQVVTEMRSPVKTSWILRNGGAYLLGCGVVVVYAIKDHWKFWNPQANGGYDYRPFFRDGETAAANLVLYSTSVLFAAIAALGGCALISVFRSAAAVEGGGHTDRGGSRDDEGRTIGLLSAIVWAGMLNVPWQIKIWPEIEAERGWILPAVSVVFFAVGILPLLLGGRLAMLWDFERIAARRRERNPGANVFVPRRSELAVWNFVLFPFYPWLRCVRAAGGTALCVTLILASGLGILGLVWGANRADQLYDFDDWQGMLKSGLFPFLRVAFSLLGACFIYVLLRRAVLLVSSAVERRRPMAEHRLPVRIAALARPAVVLLGLASLAGASWPFWGWRHVSENVFTRVSEHSYRHTFELTFLHWLLDFDRDGYSAVLHGADPDDFDASIQPAYLDPPREDNAIPVDHFAIADRTKAREFPNLIILFLEGVTPRSISAYGQRQVAGTPNMDAIAREGTVFTQARCFYPSTWDAWFSVVSGRYLRVKEFDMSRPFGDRYSRYNNLYRVLTLAGVNRWCHADTPPYSSLLVAEPLRKSRKSWMPNFDSSLSAADEERGVWRGDKRNERMLKFLDDLKPGDKFFLCEHMSDTHFPWKQIDGLEWASEDAVLHNGTRNQTYRNYFQAIARMDQQVGQIVRKLKDKGLYENTMFVIVSDHGCQWWEHEHMYYVSHLYDQCLLVPLIVRVPPSFRTAGGPLLRNHKVADPVLQVDLLNTIMEIAGVRLANPRDDFPFPGRSLLPLMDGTATARQRREFRERDVPLTTHHAKKLGVLSQFRYKLIFNRPLGTYKLFDLERDPKEMVNLVDDRPELLEEMLSKLRRLIRQNPAIIGGIKGTTPAPGNG